MSELIRIREALGLREDQSPLRYGCKLLIFSPVDKYGSKILNMTSNRDLEDFQPGNYNEMRGGNFHTLHAPKNKTKNKTPKSGKAVTSFMISERELALTSSKESRNQVFLAPINL